MDEDAQNADINFWPGSEGKRVISGTTVKMSDNGAYQDY